jgi:ABC-type transporter Mla MlaB component
MLKITERRDPESDSTALMLEGRLAGPWVEELKTYCREMAHNQQPCTMVDLTGVTFIDTEGKALLACLWRQGAELKASGCLTRCVVNEIIGRGKQDS